MRCLVVDDDALSRHVIEHFIEKHDALEMVSSCDSAIEAANVLQQEEIDLVFLDIEMPEMSGLELVKSLTNRPQIILVTAKEQYALEAFDIDVTDYLLKPVSYARFLKAVQRAQRLQQPVSSEAPQDPDHVFIRTDGRLVKLDLKHIQWIEAQGDYVMISAPDRQFLVHSTMKAMEDKLPTSDFVRVHRSYIVRIDQINDIEDTTIVINRKVIPIGASYKDALLKRLNTI